MIRRDDDRNKDRQTTAVCPRCGKRTRLVVKTMDSTKKEDREIRVYECECGQVVWDD
jgi:hypothetical protein